MNILVSKLLLLHQQCRGDRFGAGTQPPMGTCCPYE